MNEKKTDKLFTKTEKKILFRNFIIFLVLVILAVVILVFPDIKLKKETATLEFSAVDEICELAVLRCYYHDVAEYEKQPDGLFKYGLFQYGYKKLWLEYDGIVEVGIDVNEVQIDQPDENGVVRIYVPDAKILNVDVDEYSMSDPIVDTGVFTTITSEEKANAFSAAQVTMKENAETDKSILNKARNNAKELLEQYIVNLGKQMGQKYKVEWIENNQSSKEQEGEQL